MSTHASDAREKVSVAIVDDDASVRVGLQRLCEAYGLSVRVYASGPEFLAAMAAGLAMPDCLLLDAHMPLMTGPELQGHLVAHGVSVPTIFFTADDTPLAHLPSGGDVTYLRKPVSGERLFAAIGDAVRGRGPNP